MYLLVHTRWLKPYLQDHKHLMVALMIVVPLVWLLALARGWKRLGPRWLGLECGQCRQSLCEPRAVPAEEGARCPHCGAAAFETRAGAS